MLAVEFAPAPRPPNIYAIKLNNKNLSSFSTYSRDPKSNVYVIIRHEPPIIT